MFKKNTLILMICCISIPMLASIVYGKTKTVSLQEAGKKSKNTSKGQEGAPVSLYVFEEKVKTIITEIAKKNDISVKIADGIRGVVRKTKLSGPRRTVLDDLSKEFNFDWFEYNRTIYVSRKSDRSTKFIKLGNVDIDRVTRTMRKSGTNLGTFLIRKMNNNTISVSGPPSYVAIVETIIDTQKTKEKRAPRDRVCVIKGTKPKCVDRANPLFKTTEVKE